MINPIVISGNIIVHNNFVIFKLSGDFKAGETHEGEFIDENDN